MHGQRWLVRGKKSPRPSRKYCSNSWIKQGKMSSIPAAMHVALSEFLCCCTLAFGERSLANQMLPNVCKC